MTEHTYVNVPRPLDQRPFTVDTPCPECGQQSIIGLLLVNEREKHMHTWYACTFWSSLSPRRCGWTGWSVPEPEAIDREQVWNEESCPPMTEHTLTMDRSPWGCYGHCSCGWEPLGWFMDSRAALEGKYAEHVRREADWDVIRSALTKGPGVGRLAAAMEALARLRGRP